MEHQESQLYQYDLWYMLLYVGDRGVGGLDGTSGESIVSIRPLVYVTVCRLHAATIPNWYSEINVTFYSVTLARTIWLLDDGPRTETSRSVFNVSMCKFLNFIYVQ